MTMHITATEAETITLAAEVAARAGPDDVYLLSGTLGAGKSIFARAFIRALCGQDTEVPSPTFTLLQSYEHEESFIWHFDLYRLHDPEEIFEIGWEEALTGGIVLVEWPERLGPYKPAKARRIVFEIQSDGKRSISIDD